MFSNKITMLSKASSFLKWLWPILMIKDKNVSLTLLPSLSITMGTSRSTIFTKCLHNSSLRFHEMCNFPLLYAALMRLVLKIVRSFSLTIFLGVIASQDWGYESHWPKSHPSGTTITAKKCDIWLEGSCFLARCHTFLPL